MPTFSKRIKSSDLGNLRRRAASHGILQGVYTSSACGTFAALPGHQQAPDLLNTSLVSIRHSKRRLPLIPVVVRLVVDRLESTGVVQPECGASLIVDDHI